MSIFSSSRDLTNLDTGPKTMTIPRVSAFRHLLCTSVEEQIPSALLLWSTVLAKIKGRNSRDFCHNDSIIVLCLNTEMVTSFW